MHKPILQGSTVLLRPLGAADTQAVMDGLSDAETNRLTGTVNGFTYEKVLDHYTRIETAPDRIDFGIEEDGALVGETILSSIGGGSAVFRIAIWEKSARDRGLGTEAMALVFGHGFDTLDLRRITLEVYAFNPRAIHIYRKFGFRQTGHIPDALIWDGEPVDALEMTLTAQDYRRLG